MPISRRHNVRFVASLVVALTAGVLGPAATARAGDHQHQVLVLFGSRPDAQFAVVAQRQLPALLKQSLPGGVDYYSEYLDVPRFADREYETAYLDFLRLKYKAQRIDLIVLTGTLSVDAMNGLREIFHGAPIVFYALRQPSARVANSTGLVNELHFRGSIDLAVALQPDLEHVFVVSGAGPSDRAFEQLARSQFLPLEKRVEFTYLSGLVTRDLEARLKTLPRRSAVFVGLVTRDGAGENFHEMDYLARVASVASAPTYSWADAAVDSGIVGGTRRNHPAEMQAIVTLAVRVLQGASADDIPVSSADLDVNQVDWRQLRRWGISEARVPAGTVVLFRDPGLWDRYKSYIIGSLALLLTQTALIAGLLVQRSKRRQTELELRRSQIDLRASYDRIQHLGRRLLHDQEEERGRVARELHDDICQQLGCLVFELEMLRRGEQQRRKADRTLAAVVEIAQGAVNSVRNLSHQLHPEKLRLIGLVAAIRGLVKDLSAPGLTIAFSHKSVPEWLPDDLALSLFRIVQEALNNIVKHSGATRVSVALSGQAHQLALSIADDGVGFNVDDTRTSGLGLLSIQERLQSLGGRLDILSQPGSGTQLEIRVPITAAPLTSQPVTLQGR